MGSENYMGCTMGSETTKDYKTMEEKVGIKWKKWKKGET